MIPPPRLLVCLLWATVLGPGAVAVAAIVGAILSGDPFQLLWLVVGVFVAPVLGAAVGAAGWAGAVVVRASGAGRWWQLLGAFAGGAIGTYALYGVVPGSPGGLGPIAVVSTAAGALVAAVAVMLEQDGRARPQPQRRRRRLLGWGLGALVGGVAFGEVTGVLTVAAALQAGGDLLDPPCHGLGAFAQDVGDRAFPPRTLCLAGSTVYSTVPPWSGPLLITLLALAGLGVCAGTGLLLWRWRLNRRPASGADVIVVMPIAARKRAGAARNIAAGVALLLAVLAIVVPPGLLAQARGTTALRGDPAGYWAVGGSDAIAGLLPSPNFTAPARPPAAVPPVTTPPPTRTAPPAAPATEPPAPRSSLTEEALRTATDLTVVQTLLAVKAKGPVTTDITQGTSTAAAEQTCDGGGHLFRFQALVENVTAPDTNQALYDRITAAWRAAGYRSGGVALGTQYYLPPQGATTLPVARFSIRGVSEGVQFSLETLCSSD
ncbi:MAG TPA: hypothetical protein VGC45_04125 [Gryllotalpicola sp.]